VNSRRQTQQNPEQANLGTIPLNFVSDKALAQDHFCLGGHYDLTP